MMEFAGWAMEYEDGSLSSSLGADEDVSVGC